MFLNMSFCFFVSKHSRGNANSHSKRQMESRMSLAASKGTERELNGSKVQERWSRYDGVSSTYVVQTHVKLFGG